jgi:hypothetical protein
MHKPGMVQLADTTESPEISPSAFGATTALVARVAQALFIALLLALPTYIAAIAWELNSGQSSAAAVHIDFVAFWAAAKLAVAGQAVAAFDPAALVAAQSLAPDAAWNDYTWHYPPAYHMLITPLGLLGFSPAFAIFSGVALGAYIWAMRGWAAPVPGGLSLAVAAPPVLFVLLTGNASLLWAAALLAALACLKHHKPRSAGAMIALLSLKPQLGLLIPVALIAGGHWRVLLWAAAATAAIAAVTIAVFGIGYWQTFFATMARTTALFAEYGQNADTMITWYAFARQFGAGHESATLIQILSLAASAIAVGVVWRRGTSFDLKAATLCLATLISTPYAFQYELVLALAAALFLARAGVGTTLPGRLWLAVLWALPLPGWLIGGLEIAQYAAPVLTLSVGACLLLARLQRPAAAPVA